VLGDLPVRVCAWDGSTAGPDGAPTVVLRSRTVLRRLLWDPSELGLTRTYVAGELDVDGDLAEWLSRVWSLARSRPPVLPGWRDRLRWAGTAVRLGVVGPVRRRRARRRCPPGRSTTDRDGAAISSTTTRATSSTRPCSTSTWPTPAPTSGGRPGDRRRRLRGR
jgi:cyclopropane-fatty-acyl-phospholipid synthase